MDADVAVVGAGIIGLASAVEIARAGRSVVVIDPHPGGGSSFAAAGMLAPGAESTPENAELVTAAQESRAAWPSMLATWSEIAGSTTAVHEVGSVFVGWDQSDQREWYRYFDIAARQGILFAPALRGRDRCLDGLVDRLSSGWTVPGDAYVDPDGVLTTLRRALDRLGARLIEDEALECTSDESRVHVGLRGATVSARVGLITTGYSPRPLAILSDVNEHLRPVRGVSLRVRTGEPEAPMVRGLVRGRPVYVIRRSDGTAVIGASSEEHGDAVAEVGTVRRLLEDATLLVPSLDESEFLEVRVGLRPATSSQHPFFLRVGSSRWAWSSGHFRHGFLLAPDAARRAAGFVDGVLRCG